MQKIQSAGVEVAARRHTRQRADVMAIENNRFLRQAFEVGGRKAAAIGGESPTIETIEEDEYELHTCATKIVSDASKST